jgi:hypothetical protein
MACLNSPAHRSEPNTGMAPLQTIMLEQMDRHESE